MFRKNQITCNFYTFVSEIKHETSKATEAEIKVISATTGISKLSKTLLKKIVDYHNFLLPTIL